LPGKMCCRFIQTETYETLYRRLADITHRNRSALGQDDFQALMGLLREHRDVMGKLNRAGLSRDIKVLKLVEEIHKQVQEVVEEIGKRRNELGRQLVMFEKKKKVSAAYAGAMLPIMVII
jgi:Skp family chaperone for outer membrane proteins